MNDSQLEELLDRLDQADSGDPGRGLRGCHRFSYREKELVVTLLQPGGTAQSFLVPARNISATGFSFLHGGFVHIDSTCLVRLITTASAKQELPGRVIRCIHIEGRIHEIGIRFDQRIDVAVFSHHALERHVLVADDDPSMRRLFSFFLKELNADVALVAGGEEAVEEAEHNTFDLILMDLDMPAMGGVEAMKLLRSRGYRGTIIAVTGHAGQTGQERCLSGGFDDYLVKPVSKEALEALLIRARRGPIYSTLSDGQEMDKLIATFVEELEAKVESLEEAAACQDLEAVQCLVRSLKGEAGSYGFKPITDSAEKVLEVCASGEEFWAVAREIRRLVILCQAVRSPVSETGAADWDESGHRV